MVFMHFNRYAEKVTSFIVTLLNYLTPLILKNNNKDNNIKDTTQFSICICLVSQSTCNPLNSEHSLLDSF